MRRVQIDRRKSLWLVLSLATVFTFILTACGTNSGAGSSSNSGGTTGTTPVPVATGVTSPNGCPTSAVVGTPSTQANVVLKASNSNTAVTARLGDMIEVQLPFGQMWNGPTTSQGVLQLQTPYGFASQTTKSCIWLFKAQAVGTSQLSFYGKAMCHKGQMCAQYVLSVPFTIQVK